MLGKHAVGNDVRRSELIALLIITVAYQADWQHHVWNTLMVYIMGILCDGIPIVFFQRYAVARNPVHHHMGPGTIVMGNFIFFLLEVIIERKVGVKRSYYIKNRHWLAMLSVPVISIIVCIRILLPDRRGVRSTIVLFLLFINVFIFYLHDEVQKSYIETAKTGRDENSDEPVCKRTGDDDEITGQAE